VNDAAGVPPVTGMVLPGSAQTAPAPAPMPAPAAAAPRPAFDPVPTVAWAGFWRRFWAYWIDGFLSWFLGLFLTVIVRLSAGVSIWPLWKESAQSTPMLAVMEIVVGLVFWLVYFAGFESSERQATPGKSVLSLKVTDLSGRRIGFGRAVGRRFATILSALTLGIGFAMAGFTRRRQALHDMIAGTLVIRVPKS
jgi:uncharacterized RDD family membrane protein YckC